MISAGRPSFQKLEEGEYELLRRDAHCLEADADGEKVLRLTDGQMLKLFRRKSLFSKALLVPYSRRFCANAQRLRQHGVATVDVTALYTIPHIRRTAVRYKPLPGRPLSQLSAGAELDNGLARRLGQFIAGLHDKGIYFRSLHPGNIILMPDDRFGLIDVADMRVGEKSLGGWLRLRNFKHFFRYGGASWPADPIVNAALTERYLQAAKVGAYQKWYLSTRLARLCRHCSRE